jgi:transposase
MPAPIPMPVRQVIFKRWRKGESVVILAKELNLSVRTVQHLIRRFDVRGQNGLETDYARCSTNKLPTDSNSFQKAIAMRQQHPGWGGGLIRVVLKEQGIESCPSVRTLQRWFRRSLSASAPPGRRPASDDRRAHAPHDVWQMDAVDQLPLASGQQVSWLRVVDECSGAVLQTTIFPPAFLEFGQACGRPGDGQTLDRTRHLPGCHRIATTHGRHGSHSARSLSQHSRKKQVGGVFGIAADTPAVQQSLGETPLGSRIGPGPHG